MYQKEDVEDKKAHLQWNSTQWHWSPHQHPLLQSRSPQWSRDVNVQAQREPGVRGPLSEDEVRTDGENEYDKEEE